MTFGDLKTGDVLIMAGVKAVVLAIESPHPLNPSFLLIVWYIFPENRTSFDMLHPDYELLPGSTVHQDGFWSWRKALELVSHG